MSTERAAVSAAEARRRILSGRDAAHLRIAGHLNLSLQAGLRELPPGLTATSLDLTGCTALRSLPADLEVKRLILTGCTSLHALPPALHVFELVFRHAPLRALPPDLRVDYLLDLTDAADLAGLPPSLKVGSLILRDCHSLGALPEGLDVFFLDITGCTRLTAWPASGPREIGRLIARGCTGLRSLPDWFEHVCQLDVRGCTGLTHLSPRLTVSSWLDVADTALTRLPLGAAHAQLRWRGVRVDPRIAFQPDTIAGAEVLATRNVELRRVLLERMGYERFLTETRAEVLDRDRDPGGERQLVRVPLRDDEPLVCVAVRCPSTARQYVIRVPPTMRTCHQAVAWVCGFDDASDYRPIAET